MKPQQELPWALELGPERRKSTGVNLVDSGLVWKSLHSIDFAKEPSVLPSDSQKSLNSELVADMHQIHPNYGNSHPKSIRGPLAKL